MEGEGSLIFLRTIDGESVYSTSLMLPPAACAEEEPWGMGMSKAVTTLSLSPASKAQEYI